MHLVSLSFTPRQTWLVRESNSGRLRHRRAFRTAYAIAIRNLYSILFLCLLVRDHGVPLFIPGLRILIHFRSAYVWVVDFKKKYLKCSFLSSFPHEKIPYITLKSLFRIRDILVRVLILRSVHLITDSDPDSALFVNDFQDANTKWVFSNLFCLLLSVR